MNKKMVMALILGLGLLTASSFALADNQGPQYDCGGGAGSCGGGYGYGAQGGLDEQSAEIMGELAKKKLALRALMSSEKVDEAKAKQLVGEINTLRGQLSEKRIADELAFRKRNPDYRQDQRGWGKNRQGYGGCRRY